MAKFKHSDVRLVQPAFDSRLTDLVIELDHLRKKRLGGTTHPHVFFQLKSINIVAAFREDYNKTIDAVVRNFEIIG
jgi:hypothetical protein